MTDESTTGEKLGRNATAVLVLVRDLEAAGLANAHDGLDAIASVVQAFGEDWETALAAIDEVRAYLDRPVVPEYPGGTTTTEGQPRAVPRFEATPDPSEPAGALATPPPPGSPGGPPEGTEDEETVALMSGHSPDPVAYRKVRPTPRIKDPNQKTRPRLPDGLGQLGAVEGDR